MPWRFILIIIIFALFLGFIGLNLENKCDINFGFAALSEIPIFFTIFVSFIFGLLFALPFVFSIRKKNKEKPHKEKNETDELYPYPDPAALQADPETSEKIKQDAAAAKERFAAKKRGGK
ncbi:MAG: LapA family protein [Treponema sp.]|jgi:uncharacterized integral membrane protein|nr:LapA family protein [Treponema sp.]